MLFRSSECGKSIGGTCSMASNRGAELPQSSS
jgi:hypothetical protein